MRTKAIPTQERAITDPLELYNLASRVHSNNVLLNRDMTLAKLDNQIVEQPLAKFVREQLKLIGVLQSYMETPMQKVTPAKRRWLEAKYGSIELVKAKVTEYTLSIVNMLRLELDSLLIQTRSGKGEILLSMLLHGKTQAEQADFLEGVRGNRDIYDKLMEKKPEAKK